MDQSIIDLAKIFERDKNSSNASIIIFERLFPDFKNKKKAVEVLKEIFLRPYMASKEISDKLTISRGELLGIYSLFRSSKEIKELLEYSPYHYFIRVIGDLIKERERTISIIEGNYSHPPLRLMELFISEACNANCKFCYRSGKNYAAGKKMLSTKQFVNIINQFADLNGRYLDISGGLEPLLGPSILDVLKTALERKLKAMLYTNGISLDNPILLDYFLRLDKIRVSLNASNRKDYYGMMQVDKFDIVINNLINLVKHKKDRCAKVPIGINFIVSRTNYRDIFDMIKISQDMCIDFLDLRMIHITDSGFDRDKVEELRNILNEIKEGVQSGRYGNLNISIADTFNFIFPESDFLKNIKPDFVGSLVNYRFTVTPHGEVYALNVIAQPTREDKRYLLGDFSKDQDLYDILKDKKTIPFEPDLFLPHDYSLVMALSKLWADIKFGVDLNNNPFNLDILYL